MLGVFIVLGLTAGYCHASLVESWCHDRIQHARSRTLKRFRHVPLIGRLLRAAHASHTVVHHGMTFRPNYVMQFQSPKHRDRAAAYVKQHALNPANNYGLTLAARGVVQFLVPFMVLNLVVAVVAPAAFSIPFALASLISPALSRFVHPYLHSPYEQSMAEAPLLTRLVLRSRFGRAMWVRHFVHHRHPRHSFNLMLPVGDWLRGVVHRAHATEIEEIRRLGGPT